MTSQTRACNLRNAGRFSRRAQLSAGLAPRRVYRYTYKVTEAAGTVCRLVLKERRTRFATPSESGHPTAYGEQEIVPRRCHTCHSMTIASCAIVTDRASACTGMTQVQFKGSYQSVSSSGYRRSPSAPTLTWQHHCRSGERRADLGRGSRVAAHSRMRRANTRLLATRSVDGSVTSLLYAPSQCNGGGGPVVRTPPPSVP